MKTETEVYRMIIDFADKYSEIRAVLLIGSRASPNCDKDQYQDYDIIYLVTDVATFKVEEKIHAHFGKPILEEQPEGMLWPKPDGDGTYGYLLQYRENLRIDIGFCSIEDKDKCLKDSIAKVLVDKDNLLQIPEASEQTYLIKKPTQKLFQDCCTEFFWALGSHIPKTYWRKELPLLKFYIEVVLRDALHMMIEWYIGIKTDFTVSIGKRLKRMEKYLDKSEWEEYKKTYSDSEYENIWESLITFHCFFHKIGTIVATKLNYPYPQEAEQCAIELLQVAQKKY